MKRLLAVLVVVGLVVAGAASSATAVKPDAKPTKPTAQITYVVGQWTSTSTFEIVVRAVGLDGTNKATVQVTAYDVNGAVLEDAGAGEFLKMYSGAGTDQWSSEPLRYEPRTGVHSVEVRATIAHIKGRTSTVLDEESGSGVIAGVPLAEWVEFYKA
jgi:hypothetical protein